MSLSIHTRNKELATGIPHITPRQKIIYDVLEDAIIDQGINQILGNQLSEILKVMVDEHPELTPGQKFINKRTSELGLEMLKVINND